MQRISNTLQALVASVLVVLAPSAQGQLAAAFGFNEGTGGSTVNAAGGGAGTLSGATWALPGRIGNALAFNGSSARVDVADAAVLDLTSALTLEAWVYPTSLSGTRSVIVKERSGGFAYALFASNGAARPAVSLRIGNTTLSVAGSTSLPLNAWSHLAATYDGAALLLYVNGAAAGSRATTGPVTTTTLPLRIGGNTRVSGQYFAGRIDEVRIYRSALSAAQVQADVTAAVDQTPPTIAARTPAAGATGVAATTKVTVSFSEAMAVATLTSASLTLRDAAANAVAASIGYDAATRVATLTPAARLADGATYTATVADSVTDASGNALVAASTWSFTTATALATTTTLTASPNPSQAGQPVSFTATVAPVPPASGTPTGTVQFRIDGADFGAPVTLAGGIATSAATTSLAVGSHAIGAAYAGSASYQASSAAALTHSVGACGGANPIARENCLPGSPAAEWDVDGAGDAGVQGFATDISANRGETVSFKIAAAVAYRLDIYRLGYYGGLGARKVASLPSLPAQSQPACLSDAATGLVDCGNWSVSASWTVPVDAASGIYVARPTRLDDGGASHIVFVVRDDASISDIVFQTSDTTWQAYNSYGGNFIEYPDYGYPTRRAFKGSYNRPFTTRERQDGLGSFNWLFHAGYPMLRWLEANGYDVSYTTGVDSDRRGHLLRNHRLFLAVGHDEYWSGAQRANVEAARDAGVHLAFFAGNSVYRKIRWESGLDASGAPYRVMVCYKESNAEQKIDPVTTVWTGSWRDGRFSPPADGGRPENALHGTLFGAVAPAADPVGVPMSVPERNGKLRFWRNTPVAALAAGQSATLGERLIGYEFDEDIDNGFRPAGLFQLSSTTVPAAGMVVGSNVYRGQDVYPAGTATHAMTLYRAASGALVFSAGSVQWSWGLDDQHDGGSSPPVAAVRQATVNLLADMGAQPATLQAGLTPAAASTDVAAPSATITAPAAGATVPASTTVTISGSAADLGGGVVAAVEVSVDGGTTWRRANGQSAWSLAWTTPGAGTAAVIRARAVDDSGNLSQASAGIAVTVGSGSVQCPCSVWDAGSVPAVVADADASAVELGVKFRSSVTGYVSALRFYKGAQNVGPHVGKLWSAGGVLLASVSFANETAEGWQQATLPAPVAIAANTTYVASYHTASGRYAVDENYFAAARSYGPLSFLASGQDGANGVYAYGSGGFPTQSWNASNYWVDVVFTTAAVADTQPPSVLAVTPGAGARRVDPATVFSAGFNEMLAAASVNDASFVLRDAAGNAVAATVGYDAAALRASLTPLAPLALNATYTAMLRGGAADPRIKDAAANALAADYSWSVTTAGTAPTQGPGGPLLLITARTNPFSGYYAEILRAEGLNLFTVAELGSVDAALLAAHDLAVLGETPLTAAQAALLTDWVNGGGRLIAMRPDKQLAGLLGLADAGGTLARAYLRIDTGRAPGAGLVGQSIQYHGSADRYALDGATAVALLYANATTATTAPAVTLRAVGSQGGQAAAFAYDLARSVVYLRQGNPAWAGQERDGVAPMRSDDLYFGAAAADPQPDWLDLDKVAIPQADEQQRLLANLIVAMNQDRRPLPRFWYLPRALPAAVVMTGDDHGNGGTAQRFAAFAAASPAGCRVADWECLRATSYLYPGTPLSAAQASTFDSQGFEVALHVTTNCADWTAASLATFYATQLAQWSSQFPSLAPPATNRTHCIAWSDYATQPQVALEHGIRFDANYYYWPPAWVANRPGFFTGSGLPMRFAQADGTLIDVYQAATQLTDESGQSYPFTIDTLLDRALGSDGYFGVFTANMHLDDNAASYADADSIVASARARGVPVVSARQMLDWLDARNASSFSGLAWNGTDLAFDVSPGTGANGLTTLVPVPAGAAVLAVTRDGAAQPFTVSALKGVKYALLGATAGSYRVTFGSDAIRPRVATVAPSAGATDVARGAAISAVFSEALDAATISAASFQLRNAAGAQVAATVSYAPLAQTATLLPAAPLAGGALFTATVKSSVADLAGNTLGADQSWSFTTSALASLWSAATVPANLDSFDANAVELGLKFSSDVAGSISAIRFYRGPNDTGGHSVSLWRADGTLLARADRVGGSASGWQEVALPAPVAITPGAVYVASYHSSAGRYPYDGGYFTAAGRDSGVLHAPASAAAGGNGVYLYGAGGFPTGTYNGSNYWIDVVFRAD